MPKACEIVETKEAFVRFKGTLVPAADWYADSGMVEPYEFLPVRRRVQHNCCCEKTQP